MGARLIGMEGILRACEIGVAGSCDWQPYEPKARRDFGSRAGLLGSCDWQPYEPKALRDFGSRAGLLFDWYCVPNFGQLQCI
jgi:hypothetical protein